MTKKYVMPEFESVLPELKIIYQAVSDIVAKGTYLEIPDEEEENPPIEEPEEPPVEPEPELPDEKGVTLTETQFKLNNGRKRLSIPLEELVNGLDYKIEFTVDFMQENASLTSDWNDFEEMVFSTIGKHTYVGKARKGGYTSTYRFIDFSSKGEVHVSNLKITPILPVVKPWPPYKPEPADIQVPFMGMALAGGEFSHQQVNAVPGTMGHHYGYPKLEDFQRMRDSGYLLQRVPFFWDRVQRNLFGPLHEPDMVELDKAVDAAEQTGCVINLDMHNYFERHVDHKIITINQEYDGKVLVPLEALHDAWIKIAERYKGRKGILQYGIMNEPRGKKPGWWTVAQQIHDSIRAIDPDKWMTFCLDGYANTFGIKDKQVMSEWEDFYGDRAIIEGHVYFDTPHGGQYHDRNQEIDPMIGVRRVQDFIKTLESKKMPGCIGELGLPYNMPQGEQALINILDELYEKNVHVMWWAAGSRWSLTAANATEVKINGQMQWRFPHEVLQRYVGRTVRIKV